MQGPRKRYFRQGECIRSWHGNAINRFPETVSVDRETSGHFANACGSLQTKRLANESQEHESHEPLLGSYDRGFNAPYFLRVASGYVLCANLICGFVPSSGTQQQPFINHEPPSGS
jgi:hypothetical protein